MYMTRIWLPLNSPWHGNLSNEFIQLFVICVMESSDERERNPGDDLSLILNGKNIYWTYKKLPPVIITQPWNTSCVWHPITVIHFRPSGARAINKANQNEAVKWVVTRISASSHWAAKEYYSAKQASNTVIQRRFGHRTDSVMMCFKFSMTCVIQHHHLYLLVWYENRKSEPLFKREP